MLRCQPKSLTRARFVSVRAPRMKKRAMAPQMTSSNTPPRMSHSGFILAGAAAGAAARLEGVPLYVYGVGITSPRDIILQNLFAPDVTFVKDEVPLTVRVRAQGLSGESAELQLKLGGQVVASRTLTFTNDSELVVPLKFTPDTLGEFELTASIEARSDEAVKDNNSRTQRIQVIDSEIQGLLVDPTVPFSVLDVSLGLTGGYRPGQGACGALPVWVTVAGLSATAFSFPPP